MIILTFIWFSSWHFTTTIICMLCIIHVSSIFLREIIRWLWMSSTDVRLHQWGQLCNNANFLFYWWHWYPTYCRIYISGVCCIIQLSLLFINETLITTINIIISSTTTRHHPHWIPHYFTKAICLYKRLLLLTFDLFHELQFLLLHDLLLSVLNHSGFSYTDATVRAHASCRIGSLMHFLVCT